MDYGKILIYTYLPIPLIPEDLSDLDFEDFFELIAKAEIIRDLRIEDIQTGVNKGYVSAHGEAGG